MTEWTELKDLQAVAAAQSRGEEIEVQTDAGNDKYCKWKPWIPSSWHSSYLFRSRPAKKTKTIVLREALMRNGEEYYSIWTGGIDISNWTNHFVKWLDTPERIVEVEENGN